ncbi:MAG: anaerobic ribonucleoside-triphosphate reductase [Candidatus Bathyarchaeia archaeon]
MSTASRTHGIKILKAVSSPLRLQILNLLFDKGPLSYTELMSSLKMNPSRDAGRFAYHLKFLLKADLIEALVDQKKYALTDLGKMVIDVADRIDKKANKPKNILIRASRSAIEEFDPNKIANALIKEAKMPPEQAQKVAKEAETQLLKSKTKYLTAPLVRELVNAILIEKGLEEYRNKLTRLGIPVHDVTNLLHTTPQTTNPLEAAGQTVFKEYTLLNTLPRDIADAHLSGTLHLNNLSTWILKPTETIHDTRFFLQNGLNLETINPTQPSQPPPKNLETALATIFSALLHAAKETETTQTLEYLNTFLAPYTKNSEPTKTKEALHQFITNLSQHTDTAINLELTTPKFLAEKTATGPNGQQAGKYADYAEEAQQLASLLLEAFSQESLQKPLANPKLTVKIRPETFKDEKARTILLKAHALAAHNGTPYFANLTEKNHEQTVHSPSGFKIDAEPSGDWEIDTLRTGCLGTVTVNVPRAAYETEKDPAKFLETLKERLEMANRALDIKHQALRQHAKNLLPFLTQQNNGDQYFRLEKTIHTINLAGLTEAAEAFTGKSINDEKTQTFAEETAQNIASFINKIGKKRGKHVYPATMPNPEASTRLAQLDIERYGIAKVHFTGTRDKPHYSTTDKLTLQNGKLPQKTETPQRKTRQTQTGGNLTIIELDETTHEPEQLLSITKQLIENNNLEFFTYNRKATYCTNCKKTWPGRTSKCPQCNAVSTLTYFDRSNET